jgi:hypothetical protein
MASIRAKMGEMSEGCKAAWAKVPSAENQAMAVGGVAFVAGIVSLVVSFIVLGQVASDSPAVATLRQLEDFGWGGSIGGAVLFLLGNRANHYKNKNKKDDSKTDQAGRREPPEAQAVAGAHAADVADHDPKATPAG